MQTTKDAAYNFIERAEDFVLLTNECVLSDADPDIIETMITTACKHPLIKIAVIKAVQKIMRDDVSALLN